MDVTQSLNLNNLGQPAVNPQYLDLGYIFSHIYLFFQSLVNFTFSPGFILTSKIILSVFSVFFITIITYCIIRLFEIRKKEHAHTHHEIIAFAKRKAEREKAMNEAEGVSVNPRWKSVLEYLKSENPSDWKLAIMEADSMLEDLTDQLEFEGENLGERLKSTNKEKFKTLDNAWEAHIVRNRIAHEGLAFEITQREANRIVALYETVFREFGHI